MTRPTIERVEVPTPSTDGPVNVFILKGDAIVLVDTGPITRTGIELLKRGLRRVGAQIKHVDAILLTQAHMDHFGMGSLLGDRCHAVICGHTADRELFEDFPGAQMRRIRTIGDYAEKNGFPAALFRRVSGLDRSALTCARSLTLDVGVQDGQKMEFGNIALRVIHTPGQMAGSVCYFELRTRTLFSGDLALSRPSPMVFISGYAPSKPVGLTAYLRSLSRLPRVAARQLCPGHNRPVARLRSLAATLERCVRATQIKALRALRAAPKSAFAVSSEIAPATRVADRWSSFARTLGALELLAWKRKVRTEPAASGELLFALR